MDTILNPQRVPVNANDIGAYGHDMLQLLLDTNAPQNGQGVTLNDKIDVARCNRDFLPFKHFMCIHNNMQCANFLEFLMMHHKDDYPDFAIVAEIALVIPLNSAACERGFSAQNRIKTKSRNRLGEAQVDKLMKININGPHFAQFDYSDAKANFRAMKNRMN